MVRLRAVLNLGWGRFILLGFTAGGMLLAVVVATNEVRQEEPIILQVQPAIDPNLVRVYVGGAVVAPGIYDLPRGSRVAEAIDAAGGSTDVADTSGLGMAAVIRDSDQILVPVRRAVSPTPTRIVAPAVAVDGTTVSADVATPSSNTPAPGPPPSDATGGPINVNTANVEELETLPEIGPILAQRIIDYRIANGPFQTLDDLAEVKGISPRMVEIIRPLATTVS